MKNRKNEKKKGFTLIELVIVLAVLAIIALIAIPNFTKVRNDSLKKADIESCNQIQKITLMSIANGDITTAETFTISFGSGTASVSPANANYQDYLKDVKKPQYLGGATYTVTVDSDFNVTVITDTFNPASPNP